MQKEAYKPYWPRVIEYKKVKGDKDDEEERRRQLMKDKIKNFIESIKEKEKKEMLESVYMNNFFYAKNESQMELLFNILIAMNAIDRKFFVPKEHSYMAYWDSALSISHGQTISQPTTVAHMLLILLDGIHEKKNKEIVAYEIGTGSGWNAALLCHVLSLYTKKYKVYSVERIVPLVKFASENIKKVKIKTNMKCLNKLRIEAEDGFKFAGEKKFDYIVFTAGIPCNEIEKKVAEMAKKNLKLNGRLICPKTYGEIFIFEKENKKEIKIKKTRENFAFVPLLEGKIYG